ncbi:hypothetical protein I4F81_008600 [Pyropia yezoensis]|uniref:Uncharacterized protein n=1 Tax=Pyropia yezoensis TaxID=2788 RepID=A0ACC3C7J1_PYRYE|nr:hypothetical protein I4F81_008600 [Neopyropia yezoensis]
MAPPPSLVRATAAFLPTAPLGALVSRVSPPPHGARTAAGRRRLAAAAAAAVRRGSPGGVWSTPPAPASPAPPVAVAAASAAAGEAAAPAAAPALPVVWFREGDLRLSDHPGVAAALGDGTGGGGDGGGVGDGAPPAPPPATLACLGGAGGGRVAIRSDPTTAVRGVLAAAAAAGLRLAPWTEGPPDAPVPDSPVWETFPAYRAWAARRRRAVAAADVPSLLPPPPPAPAAGLDTVAIPSPPSPTGDDDIVAADDDPFTAVAARLVTSAAPLLPLPDGGEAAFAAAYAAACAAPSGGDGDPPPPDLGRSLGLAWRLGTVSPRRLAAAAADAAWATAPLGGGGRAARALAAAADARDYHEGAAAAAVAVGAALPGLGGGRGGGERGAYEYWRWGGYLCRYAVVAAPEASARGGVVAAAAEPPPAVVLVHGFGAGAYHWAANMPPLATEVGADVYAIDLIGFAGSEKPGDTAYSQVLWEAQLSAFVQQVVLGGEASVRRRVYVGGNSIGGYMAAAYAADHHPIACAGLVLFNSAGKLADAPAVPATVAAATAGPAENASEGSRLFRIRAARMAAASLLLTWLRSNIDKTLVRVYPFAPDRAAELSRPIYTASLDWGAVDVLASGLVLPPPRSLGALLTAYGGEVLVVAGVRDPLNDAVGRADAMGAIVGGGRGTVVKVDAGHCPHHEAPGRVNEVVGGWLVGVDARLAAAGGGAVPAAVEVSA